VSLDFPVPGWMARRVVTAALPDRSQHAVYLYSIDQPTEVKVASGTRYAAENFGLELGGASAGSLKSVEGGGVSGEVVAEKQGPDGVVRKHLAGVKYEDITVNCGTGMSKAFYGWLSDTLDRRTPRQDGAIVGADRLNFYHGLVTELGFPALDASSKEQASLTVTISPEYTRRVTGKGAGLSSSGLKGQKVEQWLRSSFRLRIDGLDCTRVRSIDAFTVRQKVSESAVGELRDYATEPPSLEVPNLVVTVAEAFADSFHEWLDDFVIKGNNGSGSEKNGTLEYLSPALRDAHFTLTFRNLGIFRLTPLSADPRSVRSVRAEMYCEQLSLQTGASAVNEPVAATPPPSLTASAPAPATAASLDPLAWKLAVARSFATPVVAARAAELRPAGLRFRT